MQKNSTRYRKKRDFLRIVHVLQCKTHKPYIARILTNLKVLHVNRFSSELVYVKKLI